MVDVPLQMPHDRVRLVLPSRRDELVDAIRQVMDRVAAAGFDETATFAIRLAVEEATSNAVRHGNVNDPTKRIVIEYHVNNTSFAIDVEDQGAGFDPATVPDPTLDENIERPFGRGIMLMRAYMTEVSYNDRGNRVSLRFQNP